MSVFRNLNFRKIVLIGLIPVAGLMVGLAVGLASLVADPPAPAPAPGRMTHEQLLEAAARPDAAQQYDYYFSKEELDAIAPHIKPWDCDPSKKLTEAERYHCGVDSIFTPDTLNLIPDGYAYEGAFVEKQSRKLAGIRIVKAVGWHPSVHHA